MSEMQPFGTMIPVAREPLAARLEFLQKTYLHLSAAVGLFIAMAWFMVASELAAHVLQFLGGGKMGAIVFTGGLMVGGWLASRLAHAASVPVQYAGLVFYAALYAVFFSPLLWIAATQPQFAGVLPQAAGLTVLVFGGLTLFVLTTKKDFSFLGPMLTVAGLAALGAIGASIIFGFNLGIWFSAAMILFACGAILWDTSKVLHNYGTSQYVGAAVELFAAVMLLFWYVLRLLMQLRR